MASIQEAVHMALIALYQDGISVRELTLAWRDWVLLLHHIKPAQPIGRIESKGPARWVPVPISTLDMMARDPGYANPPLLHVNVTLDDIFDGYRYGNCVIRLSQRDVRLLLEQW